MKTFYEMRFVGLLMLFLVPFFSYGQVRPDIYSFIPSEREILVNAMMDYISVDVIQNHCNFNVDDPTLHTGPEIHSDFDFLPFHRVYIEGMEDYLISQGLTQFVPLPFWDPQTCAPDEFIMANNGTGVDPDCTGIQCANSPSNCSTPLLWCPTVVLPSSLQMPGLCNFPFTPNSPVTWPNDNNHTTGLSNNIESPYHNNVHAHPTQGMRGVMRYFTSPSTPIFWLWHAYIDDIWKEWEENCSQSTTLPVDYYMKDNHLVVQSERDRGEEPSIDGGVIWDSKDIWCRNTDDGILNQVNQNPISDGNDIFVYVRIRNRGFQNSPVASSDNKVHLYWAKAATALGWPEYWNGSTTEMNQGVPVVMGDEVESSPKQIPTIDAAGHTIVTFTWSPPDPSDYEGINDEPWHFCLLARVESNIDPMYNEVSSGTYSLYANTKNNNNIVWKNLSVIDMQELVGNPNGTWDDEKIVGANVSVGNIANQVMKYDLEFSLPKYSGDKKITDEAEVKITMEEDIWNKWIAGGAQADNLTVSREDKFQVIVTGNPAKLKNLTFAPKERGLVHLSFNFLVENMPFLPEYKYNLIQREHGSNQVLGGEVFRVISPVRNGFLADAGEDDEIFKGDLGRLDAVDIFEPAIYNWYDPSGTLVYTGKDLQVSPAVTTTYKLEVIARTDGIKDYDEANVEVQKYAILGMSPNPSSTQVNVNYLASDASSAYLTIMQPYGNTSSQYILDVNQSMTTINVSNYAPGSYSVILVCNGQSVDSETIIVQ